MKREERKSERPDLIRGAADLPCSRKKDEHMSTGIAKRFFDPLPQ